MCEQSYSVESVLQKMQTSLACTICLDLLNNPLTTKCGHTFCKDCLDRLHLGPKNSFPCPLCITPVTRRAVTQNAKITSLVSAVRNVIASIKEDCGFQEPVRNIASSSHVEPEKEELEEDVPIRRATRQKKPISYYADEVLPPPNKRRSTKKFKNQDENFSCERPGLIEPKLTSNISKNEPLNVLRAGTSGLTDLPFQDTHSKPQLSKVEQWLSKNESLNFGTEAKSNFDEDLLSTHVFQNILDIKYDLICNNKDKSTANEVVDNMWTSQTSTIIFNNNIEKILQQDIGSTSVKDINRDSTIAADEELAREETNSMVSEKENEKKISSTSLQNEKRRGSKRILIEPNKIDVKKISKINSNILINEGGDSESKEADIPNQFLNYGKSLIPKDELVTSLDVAEDVSIGCVDKEKPTSGDDPMLEEHKQHPNSKGHNIRFACSIKLKPVEIAKPAKISVKGKTKKSPGWSRIEGARRDLRSKHTSLNIRGGEQKINSDLSKLELSKLPVESSQESVVVIEEDKSQANVDCISLGKKQKKFSDIHSKSFLKSKSYSNDKLLNSNSKKSNLISKYVKKDVSLDVLKSEVEIKNNVIGNISLPLKCSNKETVFKDTDKTTTCKFDTKKVGLPNKTEKNSSKTLHNLGSSGKVFSNRDSLIKSRTFNFSGKRYERSTLNRSRLSRKNLMTTSFMGNNTLELNKEISNHEAKKPECLNTNNRDSNINLKEAQSVQCSLNELKSSPKGNNTENVDDIFGEAREKVVNSEKLESKSLPFTNNRDGNINLKEAQSVQCSLNGLKSSPKGNNTENVDDIFGEAGEKVVNSEKLESQAVPFQVKGNLNEKGEYKYNFCSHSVPCELFHMLVKYSKFFANESQECSCPNYKDDKSSPNQMAETVHAKQVVEDQGTTTESSIVPDSCTGEYVQEVAIILPDSVPGTSLKFNESLTMKAKELEEPSTDCDENLDRKNECQLNSSIYEEAYDCSQNSQLSASLLRRSKSRDSPNNAGAIANSVFKMISNEEPKPNLDQVKLNVTPESTMAKPKELTNSPKNSSKSYFDSQDMEVQEPISLISENSGEQLSKKSSSDSPITFKRSRRTQRIDSSSSSSEDELPDLVRPQKKARTQTQDSLPPRNSPKIDSEELRDFERYDENVWNYYNNKLNRKKDESFSKPNKESKKFSPNKTTSKNINRIDDTSDDEVIPGTEEVLKNIDADIAVIKERREQATTNEENLTDCESVAGTVDLFSQDSVVTTSTTCDASVAIREEEETVDDSHFSVFSTDSPVLSTQQRYKVQSEVESLRNKILALEAEMKEKKASLNQSKIDSKADEKGKETPSVKETNPEEDFERESDLESEELFKSAPAEASCKKGVTPRYGRSLSTSNKTAIKKKLPVTLICTGLSQAEASKVHTFASTLCGSDAKVLSNWSDDITHVIVKIDQEGMTERTLKYLLGVASGAWVVSVAWVNDSLTSRILLPEDEYEALDCTGAPGPSKGRTISSPIFTGFQFCLIPPFEDVSIDQLQDLIKICRGSVVKRFNEELSGPKLYVVNSEDPGKERSEMSNSKKRNKITVAHDWIIECIGMYSLVSLLNYMIGTPTPSEIIASGIPESLIHETQEII